MKDCDASLYSADNKLLLLFSLLTLTAEQQSTARDLTGQITDWQGVFETAARNHALPMVVRHLRHFEERPFVADLWDEVQGVVGQQAVHNLRVVNALRAFIRTCIDPVGCPFVVFKGVALAHRYYPDLGLRPCRDIDVAVNAQDLEPLVRAALAQGYTLRAPNGRGGAITQERDIRALMTFARSAVLISKDGVAIDLQPGIDKFSGIFGDFDVEAQSVEIDIGGCAVPVLPDAFLLNYLCHHHARHLWSRLHWISDLDAVLTSPHIDLDEALALAEQLGQRGSVDAALQLHGLASDPALWDSGHALAGSHGASFLRLCLTNLTGELALEKRLAVNMIGGEFMFPWQASPDLLQRARRNWLRTMLMPSYHQYQSLPLPVALQWLYYPARVGQIAVDSIRRRFGTDVPNT